MEYETQYAKQMARIGTPSCSPDATYVAKMQGYHKHYHALLFMIASDVRCL